MTNQDLKDAIEINRQENRESVVAMQAQLSGLGMRITSLEQTLNELTGAKKVLIWIAGTAVGIASAVIAWFGINHK